MPTRGRRHIFAGRAGPSVLRDCRARDDIDRRQERGYAHTAQRLGSQLRSAESQLRYLDRLIARLDHRFGSHQIQGD